MKPVEIAVLATVAALLACVIADDPDPVPAIATTLGIALVIAAILQIARSLRGGRR